MIKINYKDRFYCYEHRGLKANDKKNLSAARFAFVYMYQNMARREIYRLCRRNGGKIK